MYELSERKKITIMIAILSCMFFAAINQTIIGIAMPRIIAQLGGMDYYSWAITIYLLTSTVMSILVGKLSDIYGRRPFILIGIAIFIVGALLSGFSQTIFQLITYRAIQGAGAGIIMSTVFTAVGDLYAPRERAKWSGVMSAVFGLSSVTGPLMGGYIVDHFDWQWVFWIFLPLGVVAFILIFILFPKVEKREGESVDYAGSLFLTLTIVPFMLAFSWVGDGPDQYAWGSWQIIGLFSITIASLIMFIWLQTKVKSPVIPLRLFKNSVFTVSNAVGFFLNAGMMGAIIYVPFFVQGVKGISPTIAGYVTMPLSLAMLVTSAIAGPLISKTGKYKKIALLGLIMMAGSLVGMYFMHLDTPIYLLVIYMTLLGFGIGLAMPVFTLTVQNAVSIKELGVATATSQLFRSLGGTIGISILGSIMSASIVKRSKEVTIVEEKIEDPALQEKLSLFQDPQNILDQPKIEEALNSLSPEAQQIFIDALVSVREVLSYAVTTTFLAGAFVSFVAVCLTFFLKELPLKSQEDIVKKEE